MVEQSFFKHQLWVGDRDFRIIEKCIPIHMPEVSIRTQKAKKKNAEFLKSVM